MASTRPRGSPYLRGPGAFPGGQIRFPSRLAAKRRGRGQRTASSGRRTNAGPPATRAGPFCGMTITDSPCSALRVDVLCIGAHGRALGEGGFFIAGPWDDDALPILVDGWGWHGRDRHRRWVLGRSARAAIWEFTCTRFLGSMAKPRH